VDEIVRRLELQRFRVVRPETEAERARHARVLTVPAVAGHATVSDAVVAGEDLVLSFERRGDALAASLDRFRVSRAVYSVLADLAVLRDGGQAITAEAFGRLAASPRALTLAVSSAGRRIAPPTGFAQAIPGTMVMFTMLVLLTSGSIMLVVEREQGLLRRLASAPIRPGAIVLGKWTARMALALVQIAFAMLAGRVVFGMDWGPNLGMVGLVLAAWAGFNASLALALGSLARSQAQMAGIGVLASMVLAALGGCWWPIEITPSWMQSLALALPTGWTMHALHRIVTFGYGPAAAAPHLAALGGAALLTGWIGTRLFRYQ
jgi:ABC-type Na+ efflux pump permease subunit